MKSVPGDIRDSRSDGSGSWSVPTMSAELKEVSRFAFTPTHSHGAVIYTRRTYALPLFYWWPLGVILSGIFVFTRKEVYAYMQLCSSDITFVVWRYMFVIKILSLGQSFSLDLYNFTPTNVLYFNNVTFFRRTPLTTVIVWFRSHVWVNWRFEWNNKWNNEDCIPFWKPGIWADIPFQSLMISYLRNKTDSILIFYIEALSRIVVAVEEQ